MVDLHSTYVQSGALMDQGHRDKGSVLTMAVLLSDSAATEGGKFMTWKADGITPLLHDMERGDAILFNSEKCHNVTEVTRGVRHSLVVELWVAEPNTCDRYS